MDKHTIFASLSIITYVFWAIPYVYDTIKWKITPHPFSWWLWFMIAMINLYWLYLTDNWNVSIFPVIIRSINLFLGAFFWFIYIKKIKINYFDYICLILWFSSFLILYLFWLKEAVIFTIFADLIVLSPTIKKIYLNPNSEDALIRFTTMLSQIFLILSIQNLVFENTVFWVYTVFENLWVFLFILIRKRQVKKYFKN